MTDSRCDAVRLSLALGEVEAISGHLAGCESCSAEATALLRLKTGLSGGARIEPPAALDARVRALLTPEAFGVLLRPWLAGGLAVAAFAALIAALAVVLSDTPAAEYGPLLAVVLGAAYLALSVAVALPLMMQLTRHDSRRAEARV